MFAHLRSLHKVCIPKYVFAHSLHIYSQGPPLVAQGAILSARTASTPAPLSARLLPGLGASATVRMQASGQYRALRTAG